ncbi:hypothetical protein F1559_004485 [Cyanidiococcus yangmingshanensis]|uniref:Calcineurin-like phosphoesterase domain-containing protein n=1 Tax=Cyanidiococcus yangmingshanensis TaxID=2690220 RepID=A0A7J7IQF9_9RHOD|nr:hypothetical protein F1559_004485 [Cyanidiococcus yangmingshanensis]
MMLTTPAHGAKVRTRVTPVDEATRKFARRVWASSPKGMPLRERPSRPSAGLGFTNSPLYLERQVKGVAFTKHPGGSLRRERSARPWCRAQVSELSGATRAPNTVLRIACVGDVHDQWSNQDVLLLDAVVKPDIVLFTGDYGNENVRLVRAIADYAAERTSRRGSPRFIASMFGNHDAWYTASPRRFLRQKHASGAFGSFLEQLESEDSVGQQLALLRDIDVGYRARSLNLGRTTEEPLLTIVGGRPFSWGGPQWCYPRFYEDYFQVHSMEESASRIRTCVHDEIERVWQTKARSWSPMDHPKATFMDERPCLGVHQVLFLAHNGPLGLGDEPHSICGRDFRAGPGSDFMPSGDFGCPDLAAAIQALKDAPKIPLQCLGATVHVDIPLCVFGHMHERLQCDPQGYGLRQMVVEQNGTVYVNAAVVPRIRPAAAMEELSGAVSSVERDRRYHCFTIIDLEQGRVSATVAADLVRNSEYVSVYQVSRVCQMWIPADAPHAFSYETCLYERAPTQVAKKTT